MEIQSEISLEEHKKLGKILKKFNDMLCFMSVKRFNSYKTKKEARIKTKHEHLSLKAANDFRNHMEEVMFKDHSKNSECTPSVYYGREDE